MAAWTLADIKKEILDLSKLNDSRPNDAIVARMVTQVERKLESADAISATTLIDLSEIITSTSLSDELKRSLQSKVDDLAMSGSNGPLQLVSKSQSLETIYNYLSVSEFEKVQSSPLPVATQICCSRLRMIGIKSLKEKTKKSTLAFLLHLLQARGEPMPTPAEVYKLSAYVATSFHENQVQPLVPGLATYPSTPAEIGQEFIDAAYGSDKPVIPSLDLLSSVGCMKKQFGVRKTHASLEGSNLRAGKQQQKEPLQLNDDTLLAFQHLCAAARQMDTLSRVATPQKYSERKPSSISTLPLSTSQSSLGQVSPSNAAQPAPSGSSVQSPADATPAAPDQLALPAPEPQVETKAANDTQGKQQSKSLEEYEEQAMNQISHKKTPMKRPASAKPPPSMKVLTRPSAKSDQSKADPSTPVTNPQDSTKKKNK